MEQLELFNPQVGDLLAGAQIVGSEGVKQWFDFPRYKVVAIHMDMEQMFLEVLSSNSQAIGHTLMPFKSDQWQLWTGK